MSVGRWDTSPLSVHARWPGLRGLILQNKIRETHVRKTGHILPWFDKPPDDGSVPLSQRPERNIRFQLAADDECNAADAGTETRQPEFRVHRVERGWILSDVETHAAQVVQRCLTR